MKLSVNGFGEADAVNDGGALGTGVVWSRVAAAAGMQSAATMQQKRTRLRGGKTRIGAPFGFVPWTVDSGPLAVGRRTNGQLSMANLSISTHSTNKRRSA